MKEISNILSQSSWWMLNKSITKKLGIDASLILSDFISKYDYFRGKNQLDYEGYFFNKMESIEEDTTIPPYRQKKAIEILLKENLISLKKEGMPAKFYYKINIEEINSLIYSSCNNTFK